MWVCGRTSIAPKKKGSEREKEERKKYSNRKEKREVTKNGTYDTGTNLDQGSASLERSQFDKNGSTCKHTNF